MKSYGSCQTIRMGAVFVAITLPILGLHPAGLMALVIGMISQGLGLGILEACNNAQAILVQKDTNTTHMGLFQALLAFGGFIGAIIGGSMSEIGISLLFNFISVSIVLLPISFAATVPLYTHEEERAILESLEERYTILEDQHSETKEEAGSQLRTAEEEDLEGGSPATKKTKETFPYNLIYSLGFVGFIAYLGEESIGDWSPIYFKLNLHASPFTSAFSYALFTLAVAATRLSSDYVVQYFSRTDLLFISGVLSFCGLFLTVCANVVKGTIVPILMALIGLCLCGIGLGFPAPLILAMAGDIEGLEPRTAVAILSTITYAGLIIGPLLLGGVAFAAGLEWAFLVVACLFIAFVIISLTNAIPDAGDIAASD